MTDNVTFAPGTLVRVRDTFTAMVPHGITRDEFLSGTYTIIDCADWNTGAYLCISHPRGHSHRGKGGTVHDGWYVAPEHLEVVTEQSEEPVSPLAAELDLMASKWREETARANWAEQALVAYKVRVRDEAIRVKEEQGWCDEGLAEVLENLDLDPVEVEYEIEVECEIRHTVTLTVTARSEDNARDMVDEDRVTDALSSDGIRHFDNLEDWTVEGVREL